MKKRFICVVLAVAIVAAAAGTASAAGSMSRFAVVRRYGDGIFEDVSGGAWYAEYVKTAYELGLVDGKETDRFDPDGYLTIAESVKLAVVIYRTYNTDTDALGAGDTWYEPYMDYARGHDIAGAEHPFPEARATRADFAVILASALPEEALTPINRVDDGGIPDVAEGYSYGRAVYTLYRAGVLTGGADGSYYPGRSIRRSEAATLVSRMVQPDSRAEFSFLAALDAEALYAKCAPAVFFIEVFDVNDTLVKTGSGFFIDESGIAATNYHVVSGGSSAKITMSDGETYDVAGIYDHDRERDIALMEIKGDGFPALELGRSENVKTGDPIYTIGSPLGLDGSISKGIVSNALRSVEEGEYIQIDASISPGSSGGALIDAYGRAIGVTNGTYQGGQNLNFAVPIDALAALKREESAPLGSLLPDTSYYDGFFPTPDFGAYAGIPLSSQESDEEATYFLYARDSLPDDIDAVLDGYGELLEQNFFTYIGYFSSEDGRSQAYINNVYGIFAIYGPETIENREYIVVTVLKLV
ncbi:MAG: trypsin-like peptidase domain-containing protein [Oscillospiraceae bacterium]|nr:trypsin-like peptidase domain-containing protein [Oscillospiraceae bacterium]